MAITGMHALFYSPEADQLRDTLRDALGWSDVDAGGGWLIFKAPAAELAVHPDASSRHEVTLVCDNLAATIADLRAKGVAFDGEPHDERWGVVTTMVLPGDVRVMLYEPKHPTAL